MFPVCSSLVIRRYSYFVASFILFLLAPLRAEDSDNDGMPNAWELQYGLDPANAADGQGDLDGDGLLNAEEYAAATDPTVVDSDNDGFGDLFQKALQAHYRFDESEGVVAHDSSVHSYDAAVVGAEWKPLEGQNGALQLLDLDFVKAQSVSLQGATDFSVSFWIKTEELGKQFLFHGIKANPYDPYPLLIFLWDIQTLHFWTGQLGAAKWPIEGGLGEQWHHCVLVRDFAGQKLRFYLNGVLVGEEFRDFQALDISHLLIGRGGYEWPLGQPTLLDEVRFYKRQLTASEVALLAQSDSDGDGLLDGWEIEHFGDIESQSGAGDPDNDGLTNLQEYELGLDPNLADSDGDGLGDYFQKGLSAHFRLNETEGAIAHDASGRKHHGQVVGAQWQPEVGMGGVIQLQDLDYINLQAQVLDQAEDLSISFWVQTDHLDQQILFHGVKANPYDVYPLMIYLWNPQLVFFTTGVLGITDWNLEQGLAGGWHHCVFTRNLEDQTLCFYLDGELIGTQQRSIEPLSITDLLIGRGAYLWALNEPTHLDEIRFYRRELSAGEITTLHQIDTDGDGLPDWWELEHFGHTGHDGNADPDGDGLSNAEEYQDESDPNDYYNGQDITLEYLQGNHQSGHAGQLAWQPLLVRVLGADQQPFANAPLQWKMTQGEGKLSLAAQGEPFVDQVDTHTNAQGVAKAYFRFGNPPGSEHHLQAQAGAQNLEFIEHTLAVNDLIPPSIPTELQAQEIFETSATLSWNASSDNVGVAGYRIYRDDQEIGTTAQLQWQDADLEAGQTYHYRLRAYDAAQNHSPLSAELVVQTLDQSAPSQPAGLEIVTKTDTSLTLSWQPSQDNVSVAGYILHLDGEAVATVGAPPYTFLGLAPETNYSLQVTAFDADQNLSAISEPLEAVTGSVWGQGQTALVAGQHVSFLLRESGRAWSWGSDDDGRSGLTVGRFGKAVLPSVLPTLSEIVHLAAGGSHALAVTGDGQLWSWGDNAYLQLGLGEENTADYGLPQLVSGLEGVAIELGACVGRQSFALDDQGRVWSWGNNSNGQLGRDTGGANSPSPDLVLAADLQPFDQVIALASGSGYDAKIGVALRADGSLWTWGQGNRLGIGNVPDAMHPQQVFPDSTADAAIGYAHVLALKTNGTVWAWGDNYQGELGIGNTADQYTPVQVIQVDDQPLTSVVAIATAGRYNLALKADGSLWSWGSKYGALGYENGNYQGKAKKIVGLEGVTITAIAAGENHALAADDQGRIWSWGYNDYGQLGDGTKTDRIEPAILTEIVLEEPLALPHFFPLGGPYHQPQNVAINSSILGATVRYTTDGTEPDANSPLLAPGQTIAVTETTLLRAKTFHNGQESETSQAHYAIGDVVATGREHVLLLKPSGKVWAWGSDSDGRTGISEDIGGKILQPTRIESLWNIRQIAAGSTHSMAIGQSNDFWVWGDNTDGELGFGSDDFTDRGVPEKVTSLSEQNMRMVAGGDRYSVALDVQGQIWSFGYNNSKQLGRETQGSKDPTPSLILTSEENPFVGAAQIATGRNFAYGLFADGSVWSWGEEDFVGLGYGSDQSFPQRVPISEVMALAAGYDHTLALRADGGVWSWGDNNRGELGIGSISDQYFPVRVIQEDEQPLTGVIAIAAGNSFSMALKADGTLWTWGYKTALGYENGNYQSKAKQVIALDGVQIQAIAAGDYFAMALDSEGNLWSWGENYYGQLGDGTSDPQTEPVLIGPVGSENKIAIPFFFPALGAYLHPQEVTISTATPGAIIRYTLDGSEPTSDSAILEPGQSIAISQSTLIRSKAYLGEEESSITQAYYHIGAQVQAGYDMSLYLPPSGNVYSWGYLYYTGLGDLNQDVLEPQIIENLTHIERIDLTYQHTLALDDTGQLWGWGNNSYGQLGLGEGNFSIQKVPTVIATLQGEWLTSISTSSQHSMALTISGKLWAFGSNSNEQLGFTTAQNSWPIPGLVKKENLSPISGVIGVDAGSYTSLVLDENHTLWGWGKAKNLGIDYTWNDNAPSPLQIPLSNVVATASRGHTLAIRGDGSVWSWGGNSDGELGNGGKSFAYKPTQVIEENDLPLQGVVQVAAGQGFSLALKKDGTVWSWGSNYYGQLGYDTEQQDQTKARQILGLEDIVFIDAGYSHSIAINSQGVAYSWGTNNDGQLGIGSTNNSLVPVFVHLPGDQDGDSLPDWWESQHGLDPLDPDGENGSDGDPDGDGLTNSQELELGTDPLDALGDIDQDGLTDADEIFIHLTQYNNPDSDGDFMNDGYEVDQQLLPLDVSDKLADRDGDRIPNVYEYANNTLANDPQSFPEPHFFVDFENGENEELDNIYSTIQEAIDQAPTYWEQANQYTIIRVQPGTYKASSLINSRRICLLGEATNNQPPVIRPSEGDYGLVIQYQDCVVDGFIIERNPESLTSAGVKVNVSSQDDQIRFVNCLLRNHRGLSSGAFDLHRSTTTLQHCTLWNNRAHTDGDALHLRYATIVHIQNSIIWNPATGKEFHFSQNQGEAIVENSIVIGAEEGGLDLDPALTALGYATADSPALDLAQLDTINVDIHGEQRSNPADLGADELWDSDGDGIADWYEIEHGLNPEDENDALLDADDDGLNNFEEYLWGTDPNSTDSDGDGLGDFAEVNEHGTDPLDSDSDDDGMLDGYEVLQELNPLDVSDSLEDKDRDRYPNIYEAKNGSMANDPESIPSAHFIVDAVNGSLDPDDNVYTTIQEAIVATPTTVEQPDQWTIIQVNRGIYEENLIIDDRRVLLLGEAQWPAPIVRNATGSDYTLRIYEHGVVIDGLGIHGNLEKTNCSGVAINLSDKSDQVKLIHCSILHHNEGTALYLPKGDLTLLHSTIAFNQKANNSSPLEISYSFTSLNLINSILWNPSAQKEISLNNSENINVSASIIRTGQFGGIHADPLLNNFTGRIASSSSPARNVGSLELSYPHDIDGELRDLQPDLGVDEFVDTDGDLLPDHWEITYGFDELNTENTWGDPDGDQLRNLDECFFATNPLLADTDSDGIGDLEEALAWSELGKYPPHWMEDWDSDGLNYKEELIHHTDPWDLDTNDNGVFDGVEVQLGWDPLSEDTDGDGLTNEEENLLGTSPILPDTDGDGVNDKDDAYPLDPDKWEPLPNNPMDQDPPQIQLHEPVEAQLVP